MATYSAPVLGTVTLPDVSEYQELYYYREAFTEQADGAVYVSAISGGTAKHDYTMSWQNITTANRTSVETAIAQLATTYTTDNFTTPSGGTVTVTRHPQQPGITWNATDSLGTLYWSGSIMLREV